QATRRSADIFMAPGCFTYRATCQSPGRGDLGEIGGGVGTAAGAASRHVEPLRPRVVWPGVDGSLRARPPFRGRRCASLGRAVGSAGAAAGGVDGAAGGAASR